MVVCWWSSTFSSLRNHSPKNIARHQFWANTAISKRNGMLSTQRKLDVREEGSHASKRSSMPETDRLLSFVTLVLLRYSLGSSFHGLSWNLLFRFEDWPSSSLKWRPRSVWLPRKISLITWSLASNRATDVVDQGRYLSFCWRCLLPCWNLLRISTDSSNAIGRLIRWNLSSSPSRSYSSRSPRCHSNDRLERNERWPHRTRTRVSSNEL